MAGSYFDMLTEQQGIPAKPFDPVEELKRLRRELALRVQTPDNPPTETVADPPPSLIHTEIVQAKTIQAEIETTDIAADVALPPPCAITSHETAPPEAEPVTLETVTKKVDEIKKTLVVWQRSRLHAKSGRNTKPVRGDIFRGKRQSWNKRRKPSAVAQYLTTPQEGTLETVNAGLMAFGIVGIVFGVLSLFRGLETDLSVGSLVCATGAAIVVIGLGGRFLASRSNLSRA